MVTQYRILYVDDEPGLLEIGKIFLERSGQFSIDIITSASDALTLLNSGSYDAIISDYQMPGMDGIEFLKKVRSAGNTIPFILFTGRGREEIVIEAINNGADFYLQKGGDPRSQFAELEHKIHQAVQQRRAAYELQAAYEQITASEEELRAQYDEMVFLQKLTDESQQMLQQVLNTVPVRVFWKDLELRYLGCNEPFARDAGFSNPADLIGKTDFDMGWKEQADLYRADDRTVIETGIPKIGYEEPQTAPDGNRIWLRTSKIPLQAPLGNIIGILGTYEDITNTKEAEERLRLFKISVDRAYDEVFWLDFDGNILYVNDAACRVTGYTREELLGMKIYSLDPDLRPELWNQVIVDLRRQGTLFFTTHHRKKDGNILNVEIMASYAKEGTQEFSFAYVRDITKRSREQ